MDNLPKTLRTLRAQCGFPQKTMADKLGISISQYNKIENGDKPLQIDILVKLGSIFRLTPWQLLEEIISRSGTPESYFKSKAAPEARNEPRDAGDEISFYKKLANHYEQKYMELFSRFTESRMQESPE